MARYTSSNHNSFTQKLGKLNGSFPSGIAFALMALVLPACTDGRQEAAAPPPAGNVTTEEVANETNRLIGQTVTIRSEPIKKIAPNTFTVSDEQFFGTESILVVNASGQPFVLPTDDGVEVQVTGQVRNFVLAEVERDFDLDLDPEVYVEYESKPAIIAQAIALAPEPGKITEDPQPYYGKALAVTGEVEDIRTPNSFTLDEDELFGATDLLVLRTNPKAGALAVAPVKDGETVAVTGVLRPFVVADIERDYDLTWDLDLQRKLEAEYSQKPVLIADAVYPSAIPDAAK
ncbi:MAG: hypothetical protein KME12_20030 [Trichocoleus desertorum ATA4-8-CV12]|jgi:hypothetical protein|nr:hypothetical protein [Trichocoleus desertorum ATA4-8-CV12]